MPKDALHTWAIKAVRITLKRCFRNAIADCEREAEAKAWLAAELRARAAQAGLA